MVPVRCISSIRHMYTTYFAYDGPISLVPLSLSYPSSPVFQKANIEGKYSNERNTGELGYDGPLYDRFLHMTDDMFGPSPMHIKYSSYVYDYFAYARPISLVPLSLSYPSSPVFQKANIKGKYSNDRNTGELGYEGPLYNRFFANDGRYAWSQSDAYQVFVICIRQILHMTDQFFWSH